MNATKTVQAEICSSEIFTKPYAVIHNQSNIMGRSGLEYTMEHKTWGMSTE